MKYKKEIITIILTILVLSFIDIYQYTKSEKIYSHQVEDEIESKLEHGDIIFIKSEDFTSKIFQNLNKKNKISTVKLVIKENNKIYLIESNGDNLSENKMGLFLTDYSHIYSDYNDLSISVYRPIKKNIHYKKINELLNKIKSGKTYRYDYGYNNHQFESFSCLKTVIYVYGSDFIELKTKDFWTYENFDNIKFDNMELIIKEKKIKSFN